MKIGENGIVTFRLPEADIELIDKIIFTFQGYGKVVKSYPSNGVSYDRGTFFIGLNQEDTLILAKDLKIKVNAEAQINYKSGSVIKTNMISFVLERTLGTQVVEGNQPSKTVEALDLHYENGVLVIGSAVDVTDEQIRKALGDDIVTQDNFGTVCESFMTEHPEYKGEKGDPGEDGQDGADGKSAYQIAVEQGYEGSEVQWLNSLHGSDGQDGNDGQDGQDGNDGQDGKSAYQTAQEGGYTGTEEDFADALNPEETNIDFTHWEDQ